MSTEGRDRPREVVTEARVRSCAPGSVLEVPADALVTPTAAEAAGRLGVELRRRGPDAPGVLVLNWLPAAFAPAREEAAGVFAERRPPAPAPGTVVVAPFPLLAVLARAAAGSGYAVCAPDAAAWRSGAYTGEVSARMAADAGATHVLLNHRHRPASARASLPEKLRLALEAGLAPLLCLGEDPFAAEAGRGRSDLQAARRDALGPLSAAERSRVRVLYQPRTTGTRDAHALVEGADALADAAVAPRPGVALGGLPPLGRGTAGAGAGAGAFAEVLLAWRRGLVGTVLVEGPALGPLVESLRASS